MTDHVELLSATTAAPTDTDGDRGFAQHRDAALRPRRSVWESDKLAAMKSFIEFCQGRELPRYPLELFLEVSNVCNLKCAMCADFSAINPYRFQILQSQNRTMMSLSELNENIESLLKSALFVHVSGFGESTIHPKFREIVEKVSSYDVMTHFITNGQQLNSDLAEFLVEQGVHKIMVSASGATKEDYERVYIGGKFDILLDGLRRLHAAKRRAGSRFPLVEINSLGFRHHVQTFDRFVELMIDCGADIIHLKKLQPYDHIPELFEHVSLMRPWVEGEILNRAFALGAEHNVIVSADEYLHNTVSSEEEYRSAIEGLKRSADGKLSFGDFGQNAIDTFASLSRAPKPAGAATVVSRPIINSRDDAHFAASQLEIRELPEARTESGTFYCMEPFKTAYVANNGGLRPCCFSGNKHPYLGSVRHESGIDAWQGTGYGVVQSGIIDGRYPTDACQRCLRDRIGPSTHNVGAMIEDYMEWYADRFGTDLYESLDTAAPDAIRIANESPPAVIVRRMRKQAPPVPVSGRVSQGSPASLALILAAVRHQTIIDGSVPGLLEGWFERAEGNRAVGWIWSPRYPDVRLPIRVWHGRELLATTTAMRSREDLLKAGKGDGCHGFSATLPRRRGGWEKKDLEVTLGVGPDVMRLLK